MAKFKWENGKLIKNAVVEINGVEHEVTPPVVEGGTSVSDKNLNTMEDGIYEDMVQHNGENFVDNDGNVLKNTKIFLLYKVPNTYGDKNLYVELDEDFDNYAFFIIVAHDESDYRHNYFASTFSILETTPTRGNPQVQTGDNATKVTITFDPENKKKIYLTNTDNSNQVRFYLVYGVKI